LVTYDALCQLLHVVYFFLTGWDAVLVIRGRWGNGEDRCLDSFGYSRGVTGVESSKLAHLSYDNHSFSDLEGFGFASKMVWGIRGR